MADKKKFNKSHRVDEEVEDISEDGAPDQVDLPTMGRQVHMIMQRLDAMAQLNRRYMESNSQLLKTQLTLLHAVVEHQKELERAMDMHDQNVHRAYQLTISMLKHVLTHTCPSIKEDSGNVYRESKEHGRDEHDISGDEDLDPLQGLRNLFESVTKEMESRRRPENYRSGPGQTDAQSTMSPRLRLPSADPRGRGPRDPRSRR
jgi:hypothetical protein